MYKLLQAENYPAAVAALQQQLQAIERDSGRQSSAYASWMGSLGEVYQMMGELELAERHMAASLRTMAKLGDSSEGYFLGVLTLVAVYEELEDADNAEKLLADAVSLVARTSLSSSEVAADLYLEWGQVLNELEDFETGKVVQHGLRVFPVAG